MAPAYMKTDSIRVDTRKAPWMDIAKAEFKKNIKEHPDYDSFASFMYLSAAQSRGLPHLLEQPPSGGGYLLRRITHDAMGPELEKRNPEITKYFAGLKSDPTHDPKNKGRSWSVAPVSSSGEGSWHVTAWCAAFVNWCLKQAGAPHLGYATAASWLQFGTPLPTPVYGCVTIIPPARSTKSTTGHVAFYLETKGSDIVLLGGNQHDSVCEMNHPADRVLGYRWPTSFNYFLLDRGSVLV